MESRRAAGAQLNDRPGGEQRRRNAVMMDALPDLPPSPSFEDGPRLQRRPARTTPQRQPTAAPTAASPAPIWTDGNQLVASPEMISGFADASSRRPALRVDNSAMAQQPARRTRAATETGPPSRPLRATPGGSVDHYGRARIPLPTQPLSAGDERPMHTLMSAFAPPPQPPSAQQFRAAPAPRSTSEGSAGSAGSQVLRSAGAGFDGPRDVQTYAPMQPPAQRRPGPVPRSTSEGSAGTAGSHSPPAQAYPPPRMRNASAGSSNDLHGPRPPPSRATPSSSADSVGVRRPRHPHARAATDSAPPVPYSQHQAMDSISSSATTGSSSSQQPVRLVQSRARQATGSSDGQRSASGGSVDAAPSSGVRGPRHPRSGSTDSTSGARHRAAAQLLGALDPIPPSPIPEDGEPSASRAKFSPPQLFRALPLGKSERHVKGKTSGSSLMTSPPTSPPPTQTTHAQGNTKEQGWARVRTHVIRNNETPVLPQAKSKLFQFQQIWGGRGGGEPAHARQESALGGESKTKLEEDVARALWAARFGGGPRGAAAPAVNAGASTSTFALPFVGAVAGSKALKRPESVFGLAASAAQQAQPPSVRPILNALRPYIPPAPAAATHERQSSVASLDYGDAPDSEKPLLPREEDVLRVLQMPFLVSGPEQGGRRALDEERWAGFEGFEMVLRGWDAASAKAHLDRALWLVRAARTRTPRLSARVLLTLSHVLFYSPAAQRWPVNGVVGLQTLVGALFELQAAVAGLGGSDELLFNVQGITNQVLDGECAALDAGDVERVYGVRASRQDRAPTGARRVRAAVWRDAVVRCLELGSAGMRAWVLVNAVEMEWPDPEDDEDGEPLHAGTPLVAHIARKAAHRFLRAAPALLRAHDDAPRAALNMLQTRVLPAVDPEARSGCVGLMLELLSLKSTARAAAEYIGAWCVADDGWKKDLEGALWTVITKGDWPVVIRLVHALCSELEPVVQTTVMGLAIPKLFDRIANTPGPVTKDQPRLVALLELLCTAHKQQFYKPVILCAAASKDMSVIGHLHVVQALARLLPDFWVADSELMAIALLSDMGAGAKDKGKQKEGTQVTWGMLKMGQCVLALQLIEDMRKRVKAKKELNSAPPTSQGTAVKFVTQLETRIAVMLNAREKAALLPYSQRLLIVALLTEMRTFTWAPKSTPWLARIITWTLSSLPPDPFEPSSDAPSAVTDEVLEEVHATFSRLRGVYMACSDVQVTNAKQSRSTLLFSPSSLEPLDQMPAFGAAADDNLAVFNAIPDKLAAACARLLVLVCQLVDASEFEKLGSVLWRMLDAPEPSILEPACFLVMQAAEKAPSFAVMIQDDLQSNYASARRRAVHRLSVLFAWRFQIISQTFLSDRSHRRPFRMQRQALTFVPVDVGSGQFVLEQNEAELKARFGEALPRDTIRRLLEIDWVQENKPPDKRLEVIRTPFSVLPSSQLDRGLDDGPDTVLSPSASGNQTPSPARTPSPGASPGRKQLLRRKSSASSATNVVKRRPVFVPQLLGTLPSLALSVRDPDVFISSAARDLLIDFMREDAATLCRPLIDSISTEGLRIVQTVGDIRAFLHVQQILPPAMSHFVFSHLAGFLRTASRVAEAPNSLHTFAHTVPILSKLVSQVSNLGAQDLRRAKIEVFLLPAGPLWFSSSAPPGPMFPRDLEEAGAVAFPGGPLDEIPVALVAMTMIRTSQNMLLLAMLKRNPQDISVVRKNLNRLVLPTRDSSGLKQLVVGDFIPRSPDTMKSKSRDLHLSRISIALSRSYLLLVTQIFRCLPRTLSDRAELGRLLDGVNRILITHGDDIGIVSHALTACMVATTRFRRLFSSSSAFTLFMPSLIKVYCEATDQAGIRRAIEYAMSRFYQFHEDVVIFQTLDIASYMAAHPSADPILPSFAAGLVAMISSLKTPAVTADGDAAGIHGINRDQEQEALDALTVEKKPENLPLLLHSRTSTDADTRTLATMDDSLSKRFLLPNLVKFLLTIIAHDTSILRGEQFLRLLRCMAPALYHSSATARSHLRDGIHALGISIHQQRLGGLAPGDTSAPRDLFATDYGDGGVLLGNPLTPSKPDVVREEYLRLMIAFSRAGGGFGNPTMHRALELVKIMLRDESDKVFSLAEQFIVDYVKACRVGGVYGNSAVAVYQLREYAPVFQAWCHRCDFSGILTVLNDLSSDPNFAQDFAFSEMVMEQFLRPAVHACSRLAVEGRLFDANLRFTVVPLLCTALTLSGADPIRCIEQCSPTPAFLAGVVLPLCLKLKTSTEAAGSIITITPFSREAHTRAWLRLLSYALEACNPAAVKAPSSGLKPSSRPSSPDGEKARPSSLSQTPLATLAIVLQIVKIVVIRGESDLSSLHRGVWDHIGNFVLGIVAGGNANFGIRSNMPRTISLVLSPAPHTQDAGPTPRALDVFMWSMMHLVCAYRSPLTTQLRLRVLETTASLHSELKRGIGLPSSPFRNTRRLSSSMFVKPRARSSVASTPATPDFSPIPSPQITPTKSNPFAPRSPSYLSLASPPDHLDAALRGRNRFPESVTPERSTGKRILHLGLATNQPPSFAPALATPNSAGSGTATITLLNSLSSAYSIASGDLVRACFRHVRMVQMFAGYESLLLPIPDGESLDPGIWNEQATVLSKAGALEMVSRETALLIQEFKAEYYSRSE